MDSAITLFLLVLTTCSSEGASLQNGIAVKNTGELGLRSPSSTASPSNMGFNPYMANPYAAYLQNYHQPFPWTYNNNLLMNSMLSQPNQQSSYFPQLHTIQNQLPASYLGSQHSPFSPMTNVQVPNFMANSHLPSFTHLIANNPYQMLQTSKNAPTMRRQTFRHNHGVHHNKAPKSKNIVRSTTTTTTTTTRQPTTTMRTTTTTLPPLTRPPMFRTFQGKRNRIKTYKSEVDVPSRDRKTVGDMRSTLAPPSHRNTKTYSQITRKAILPTVVPAKDDFRDSRDVATTSSPSEVNNSKRVRSYQSVATFRNPTVHRTQHNVGRSISSRKKSKYHTDKDRADKFNNARMDSQIRDTNSKDYQMSDHKEQDFKRIYVTLTRDPDSNRKHSTRVEKEQFKKDSQKIPYDSRRTSETKRINSVMSKHIATESRKLGKLLDNPLTNSKKHLADSLDDEAKEAMVIKLFNQLINEEKKSKSFNHEMNQRIFHINRSQEKDLPRKKKGGKGKQLEDSIKAHHTNNKEYKDSLKFQVERPTKSNSASAKIDHEGQTFQKLKNARNLNKSIRFDEGINANENNRLILNVHRGLNPLNAYPTLNSHVLDPRLQFFIPQTSNIHPFMNSLQMQRMIPQNSFMEPFLPNISETSPGMAGNIVHERKMTEMNSNEKYVPKDTRKVHYVLNSKTPKWLAFTKIENVVKDFSSPTDTPKQLERNDKVRFDRLNPVPIFSINGKGDVMYVGVEKTTRRKRQPLWSIIAQKKPFVNI